MTLIFGEKKSRAPPLADWFKKCPGGSRYTNTTNPLKLTIILFWFFKWLSIFENNCLLNWIFMGSQL